MRSTVEYQNGILTIRLIGEVDHAAASAAMNAVEMAVEEYMPRQCVLDFSDLSFMDSSGIAVILKSERLMRQMGGGTAIQSANAQVMRVLEIAGLAAMIQDSKKECGKI